MSQPTNTPQTLDQRRAKHAMQAVKDAKDNLKLEDAKKFGGQARKMPTRIVASGLGQALAFLKAKGYAPKLLISLGDWVMNKPPDGFDRPGPKPTDDALLKAVILGTSDYLRQATDEALAYLQWLNRFCEANDLSTETENT